MEDRHRTKEKKKTRGGTGPVHVHLKNELSLCDKKSKKQYLEKGKRKWRLSMHAKNVPAHTQPIVCTSCFLLCS